MLHILLPQQQKWFGGVFGMERNEQSENHLYWTLPLDIIVVRLSMGAWIPKGNEFPGWSFLCIFPGSSNNFFHMEMSFPQGSVSQSVQEYIPASANLQAAQKACSFNCQIYS